MIIFGYKRLLVYQAFLDSSSKTAGMTEWKSWDWVGFPLIHLFTFLCGVVLSKTHSKRDSAMSMFRKSQNIHLTLVSIIFMIMLGWAHNEAHASATKLSDETTKICRVRPNSNWTPQEKWVWNRVCSGEIADLNQMEGNGDLNPMIPQGWTDKRVLRPAFLRAMLMEDPYRSAVTSKGMMIVGAWFLEHIDLSESGFEKRISLTKSRFDRNVIMNSFIAGSSISLTGSHFIGELLMHKIEINGSLYVDMCLFSKQAIISESDIKGILFVVSSRFKNKLSINGSRIGNNLVMDTGDGMVRAEFKEVDLIGVTIGRNLSLLRSTVKGKLDLNGIHVSRHLILDYGNFSDINLLNATIGGKIAICDSTVNGLLDLTGIDINSDLLLFNSKLYNVKITYGKIGGHIDSNDSYFKGRLQMESIQVKSDILMNNNILNDVDMSNAIINGDLNMTSSKVNKDLILSGINIDKNLLIKSLNDGIAQLGDVNLTTARVGGSLFFNGAKIGGLLDLSGAMIENHLFMTDKGEYSAVEFPSGKIGGFANLCGSTFTGTLNMELIQIGRDLFLNDSSFKNIYLHLSKISGSLELKNATFSDKAILDSSDIKGKIDICNSEFTDLDISSIRAGYGLSISGSRFNNIVDISNAHIQGHFLIDKRSTFHGPVYMMHSSVIGNLNLSQSNATYIDMSYARISGEFIPDANWYGESFLALCNAEVMILQDPPAWPNTVELDGFKYSNFSGFLANKKVNMADKPVSYLINWLSKQDPYSPQPYEQLANVLQKTGHAEKAEDVLIARKDRERSLATGFKRFSLTTQWLLIDYGYHNYWALGWVCFFVVVGWSFIRKNKDLQTKNHISLFIYSIDMLLPVIQLESSNYDIHLSGAAKYYFYLHKVAGYILVSFLVAGLSGLTK